MGHHINFKLRHKYIFSFYMNEKYVSLKCFNEIRDTKKQKYSNFFFDMICYISRGIHVGRNKLVTIG